MASPPNDDSRDILHGGNSGDLQLYGTIQTQNQLSEDIVNSPGADRRKRKNSFRTMASADRIAPTGAPRGFLSQQRRPNRENDVNESYDDYDNFNSLGAGDQKITGSKYNRANRTAAADKSKSRSRITEDKQYSSERNRGYGQETQRTKNDESLMYQAPFSKESEGRDDPLRQTTGNFGSEPSAIKEKVREKDQQKLKNQERKERREKRKRAA